ncbi:class I SAM-dependent methyltransferase [Acidithiobacillus ferrooxidans]|nr:class I SAM-dependent methyltransferase [Acidithiobacillus ferrooxidans]
MDSMLCTKRTLLSDEFQYWVKLFRTSGKLRRKEWEFCFIAQALREHGVLVPGKAGLGFGVGEEPLSSGFASFGSSIVATDLHTQESAAAGWVNASQHADNKNKLNNRGICGAQEFESLVEFEFANMNDIPERYRERFDFVWSSCALEHLGSIDKGVKFILDSVNCLKPGGIAVHTTEFNVSSNLETIETGPTVLFRRKDIEQIIEKVINLGCHIRMGWDYGDQPEDYHVDIPPYSRDPHLKLRIAKYTVTSIGLVIIK